MILSLAAGLVSSALAAADVTTTITQPTGVDVYTSGRWYVTTNNTGNQTASGVTLTITLPLTNTSPQTYVMGTVGTLASGCSRTSNIITCSMGNIRRGRSVQKYFDITFPQVDGDISVSATSSFSGESNTGNNSASEVVVLDHPANLFAGPMSANNNHCTGTNLTSYFECELFPSSISSHLSVFEADGSITFPTEGAEYNGQWWQDATGEQLSFYYTEFGLEIAWFDGWSVGGGCFEGVTTFDGSTYVAPYEVCI